MTTFGCRAHLRSTYHDCYPKIDSATLLDSTISRLRYGMRDWDRSLLNVEKGRVYTMSMDLDYNHNAVRTDIQNESVFLLAWHIKNVDEHFTISTALILASYQLSGKTDWTLMILSTRPRTLDSWIVPKNVMGMEDDPFRRYDHVPTNEEIYTFIDQLKSIEGRMFIFDTSGVYDWEGAKVTFVDGAICQKTWESVIGEKPTKFFPNGK